MQIATAASLIDALSESGLFTPAAVENLARELVPFGDNTQAALRHLIDHDLVPVYQLRKVIHGKTTDLFVGPFVVLDKIGEGGMGKVFKVRDVRTGRVAALKVVRPHLLANPIVRGRYEREVRAALALRHPNVAAAYEAGEVGGKAYIAMEFVDGIDLARLVQTFGILPVPEACEYLRQAALGLAHAHTRGFVHRDVKPGNVVVAGERHHPDATEPAVVKLLDMGLVRTVGPEEEGPVGTDLTRVGAVLGTPDYMAPEQAKNSSIADHRADLYSLGGAFYFLLTGKPPFPDGTPIEKILSHQFDPPPPLQASRPDVPDDLARLVARLLAKNPADRPGSAHEVAAALRPLAQFTGDSAAVRFATPNGIVGPEGVDTGTVASSKTVPPSSPGEGTTLPRGLAEASQCDPDGPPTPPVRIEFPVRESDEQAGVVAGVESWRVWSIAAVSALAGLTSGILAWVALVR